MSTCELLEKAMEQAPEVPVLPADISFLLETLADDDIDLGRLARVVETFPSIAAKLVAVANSAWAAPRVPITGLRDACVRLGLHVVRSIAIALSVAVPFDSGRCPGFDPERFWTTALLAAEAADALAPLVEGGDRDSLRTAGLIHHLGLLWLADQRGRQTAAAITALADGAEPSLEQALQRILGVGYCAAGACLGQAWGLPTPLTIAMAEHRHPAYRGVHWRVAATVGLAASLAARTLADEATPPAASVLAVSEARLGALMASLRERREALDELARLLMR